MTVRGAMDSTALQTCIVLCITLEIPCLLRGRCLQEREENVRTDVLGCFSRLLEAAGAAEARGHAGTSKRHAAAIAAGRVLAYT